MSNGNLFFLKDVQSIKTVLIFKFCKFTQLASPSHSKGGNKIYDLGPAAIYYIQLSC